MRSAPGMVVLALAWVLAGCAGRSARVEPPGVSIDDRPMPVVTEAPPDPSAAPADSQRTTEPQKPAPVAERPANGNPQPPGGERPAAEAPSSPPVPVGSVMTPDERRATLARIVADTTAAGGAVRKCGNRKLLPDQESVLETARSLLEQTRSALAGEELWRAESLARKARQLAASLECPG